MKVTIEFTDKDQQIFEAIYEDKDKDAAFDYVMSLRDKFHSLKKGDIKCGNIFNKSGEKK